ncbi:serine hydrolase domain-containing protein [Paucibacter sp. XJ19-41]|uniref:serine hydrolase domain-containing protein n=1 Tax=Paucibacter sp. XJ19-41 TaxID=2927824 RepID=UPI002349D8E4|nr:serine hydrolase domain-containing protein [Paucibacter sp. XJ19-41]MDC6169940.1 serine hydrolase [Paucibacter sp. XJ19-41]
MSTEQRVLAHLESWRRRGCLQGSVALFAPDGRVVEASGGLADPAHGIANGAQTRYRIGSLSKSFTAAAVLQLVDAGHLALDTPLARFLPTLPNAREITVLQLLRHRAGLANFTAAPDYWPLRMRLPQQPAELIAWAGALPPVAPPDSGETYSNTGYLLLAAIVEQLAGQDFDSYRRERLFEPLGLSSLVVDDGRRLITDAARGLHHDGSWAYAEPMDMSVAWGVFDLVATAGDIGRWLVALQAGLVLSARSTALMLDVEERDMACGFCVGRWTLAGRERRLAQHFGDVNGFFAYMSVLPGGGAVVVLANAFGLPVERLARELAQLAAGDQPAALLRPSATAPAVFASGRYRAEDGSVLEILRHGGTVSLRSTRRYGVTMCCPLFRADDAAAAAVSLVLPETLEASTAGCLRWTDAEGRIRELFPV